MVIRVIARKKLTLEYAFCLRACRTIATSSLDCLRVMRAGGDGSNTKLNPFHFSNLLINVLTELRFID